MMFFNKINFYLYNSIFFFFFLLLMNILFFSLYFIMNNLVIFIELEIFSMNSINVVFSILLDWMSLLFMLFVLMISSCIIMYSKSYMKSDINMNRFIILVFMFVLSMILLIISPNMISILLGWDGLGLISYCLVIYYQNIKSFNAGMLTVLSNRVGDVFILMIISWMLNYGSCNYIFYMELMNYDFSMYLISILVLIASMTKSAQIPFSSWLPAAMAAPTPVSALVHSSTLVTAGVYLLIRFNLLLLNMNVTIILLMLSSLTMFMAGISANYEFDLKKIIALSTLSQLGLMMSILCMGYYDLAFFHLLTHAMFKALLFMCAGFIIHLMNNNQDIRFMGGISLYIPLISVFLVISNMALCGMPFMSGFYSKDLILDFFMMSNLNLMIFILYYLSIGLTMFYSIRLLMYMLINDFNLMSLFNLYEEDYLMLKSMLLLLLMSLFSGSILFWLMYFYPTMVYISLNMKFMVIYMMLIGLFMGYLISKMNINFLNKFLMTYNLSNFLTMMWFLPGLSTYSLNYYFFIFSENLFKKIDLGWSEYYSSYGIYLMLKNYSFSSIIFHNNNLKIFLISFIMFMLIVFFMMLV